MKTGSLANSGRPEFWALPLTAVALVLICVAMIVDRPRLDRFTAAEQEKEVQKFNAAKAAAESARAEEVKLAAEKERLAQAAAVASRQRALNIAIERVETEREQNLLLLRAQEDLDMAKIEGQRDLLPEEIGPTKSARRVYFENLGKANDEQAAERLRALRESFSAPPK